MRSGNTEIVYGPDGLKLALMNAQALVKAFVALPGSGQAVYTNSGLAYYRHSDWLGSSRLATTTSRTKYFDVAYAPYGEDYVNSGTTDLSFTGQTQDTLPAVSGLGLYDFLFRRYHPVQGRWISPDPAGLGAVDPSNPQTWNRYAYVGNNPLNSIDPLGLDFDNDCGGPCTPFSVSSGNCTTYVSYHAVNAPGGTYAYPDFTSFCRGGGGGHRYIMTVFQWDDVHGTGPCKGDLPCALKKRLSGTAANNGKPPQTARQKCLSQAYNTPEGKAVQFLSPVSLTPLNPNWKENLAEWGIAIIGKGGGMFGSGIGTDTGIQTLNGVRNVGSWLENTTSKVLSVGEEVAPLAMAGMTLADVLIQAQCSLDPSAPLEGIPVAPK